MNAQTCRLCMKTSIGDCNILGGDLKAVLDDILLKSIPSVYQLQNLICDECRCNLQVFANFKDTLDGTSQMDTYKSDVTLDLEDIENKNSIKPVDEVQNPTACNFCAKFIANRQFIPLNELKGNTYLINMLERHIPKLNLNNNEIILSCDSCLDSLQGLLSFITNCFDIQEKVRKYTEMEGDDTGPIDLEKLQKHTFRLTLPQESGTCNSVVEKEEQFDGYEDPVIKSELELKWENEDVLDPIIKREDIDIKSEKNGFDEYNEDMKQHLLANNGATEREIGSFVDSTYETSWSTHKNRLENTMYECKKCTYEAKYEEDMKQHLSIHEDTSQRKMYKCNNCLYEAIDMVSFKQHMLIHKNSSEERKQYKWNDSSGEAKTKVSTRRHTMKRKGLLDIPVCKCEICPFETKYSKNLRVHTLIHRDPSKREKHKCEDCAFETVSKKSLHRHMLTHKDPSDRTKYKCNVCPYETISDTSIRRHTRTHDKNPPSIPIHKCVVCPYVTKYSENIGRHMLIHKDPSERKKYKCRDCAFETVNKQSLDRHMFTHKDPSERKTYKCKVCTFEAHNIARTRRHMLTHKDPSERKQYKCKDCAFETGYKESLKQHVFTHRDPSERKIYKCNVCPYETVSKTSIWRHTPTHDKNKYAVYPNETKYMDNMELRLLINEDIPEKYKCKDCAFETLDKQSLKRHVFTHKIPSGRKIYRCNGCPFETVSRTSLWRHTLTHDKNPPATPIRKCMRCPYKTKYIENMGRHLLTHKDSSERQKFKCKDCAFETLDKYYLKRHMLRHKEPS